MSSIHSLLSRSLSAAALVGLCLATAPANAGIHRCVGAGGAVTYTDQGCPAAADAKHLPDDLQGEPDPLAPAEPAPTATSVSYQTASAVTDAPARSARSKR